MNVVDSSGWMEYFSGGSNSSFFSDPILKTEVLIVPTICLFEVFKKILVERQDENAALQAVAEMQLGTVVELSSEFALEAARLSYQLTIPMADSIVLATANKLGAVLWTQDADFEKIPGVKFIRKKRL